MNKEKELNELYGKIKILFFGDKKMIRNETSNWEGVNLFVNGKLITTSNKIEVNYPVLNRFTSGSPTSINIITTEKKDFNNFMKELLNE